MSINHYAQIVLIAVTAARTIPSTASAATVAPDGSRRAGSRIAAGSSHGCAVRGSGEVRCWGNNDFGQIGDNTVLERLSPVQVTGLSNAMAVAAGDDHTCALRADGRVRCWGKNNAGQLGDNSTVNRFLPVNVSSLQDVVHIAAGKQHSCAVLISGEVRCWGSNTNGQLGDGTTNQRLTPVAVQLNGGGGTLTGVVEVALGNNHSCAMTYDARIYCWGLNSDGQIAEPNTVAQRTGAVAVNIPGNPVLLAAGANHTCVVRGDRQMRCWGDNVNGQIGDGTQGNDRFTPAAVASGSFNVTGISGGLNHTCLLRVDATVSCWGANANGQIGDGSTTAQLSPATAAGNLAYPVAIASHNRFNCALLADDQVRCWGGNDKGQVGDGTKGTNRLTAVNTLGTGNNNGRLIASGSWVFQHTCAIRASGLADCWGNNINGQLGDGTRFTDRLSPNPAVPVSGLGGLVQVAAGDSYSCGLRADGAVYCWGDNYHGKLGDGTGVDSLIPVAVSGLSNAVSIAAGEDHVCAVRVGGSIRCWGRNSRGQLGDGITTGTDQLSPVTVAGISDAVMVVAGKYHTCALRTQGSVMCWGGGSYGVLGDGAGTDQPTPVPVAGLTDAVSITAGYDHTCARRVGGSIQCWGGGYYGQVGDGLGLLSNYSPVNVSGISNAVSVSGRQYSTCAVLTGGAARCWGNNNYGQIGDGTVGADRLSPVVVTGLSDVLSLAAGSTGFHSCALTASGRPYCWGENPDGAVGDGTTTDRSTPTAVLTF